MGHVVYPTQTKVNPLNQDTVDRQTWDLPCVDKHTKVSQESINPATTTLNNTINESWVQNCDVPTIANRQFLSWGRSLDHKERKSPTHILEKNGLLSNFGCATLLSPGWWIPAKIWCGAPSKFSVPHMVLAKPGRSLSAINPPVMRSLHKSASHHWADIKQVFSGECDELCQFHHTTQRSHPISNPLI